MLPSTCSGANPNAQPLGHHETHRHLTLKRRRLRRADGHLMYLAERGTRSGLSDPGTPNPYALLAAVPRLGERALGRNGAGSLELPIPRQRPACPALGSSWP